MAPDVVRTDRLELPLWSPEDVAALRGGGRIPGWHPDFPREDDQDAAGMYQPGDPWGPRSIVVRDERGGFATEALAAMLAHSDADVVRIRASVAPDNQPSIRVLAKAGFTELRGSNEDGHLVMARPVRR